MLLWGRGGALKAGSIVIGQTLLGRALARLKLQKPVSRSFSWIEKKAGVPGVAAGFGLYEESEALTWQRDRLSLFILVSTLLAGSHGLKLVDTLLGVALADLAQGFVLVSACPNVLGVEHVVLRFLAVIPGFGQL